ncbi:protein of unknown function [Nitrospira japonica]|uniref:Uncharacterized protein n=1 Tax=Nitrospira japonica TaxID=1325564 RepID=A0A1W1I7R2_9BACT|nr:protein of unknown function [Nitrospira japonica]
MSALVHVKLSLHKWYTPAQQASDLLDHRLTGIDREQRHIASA